MEPHPIPQNVSSFQFRLIGDMTLKQFMYLAIGAGIGYVIILLLGNIYPVVAWPLGLISALIGIAFAFLPIASRPLDHWVKAFFKAVYSPTRRVWKKMGKSYKEDPLFRSRYITFLSGLTQQLAAVQAPVPVQLPKSPPLTPPTPQVNSSSPLPKPPSSTPIPTDLPTSDELKKTVDLAKQAQNLQMQIVQTERTLSKIKSEATKPTPVPVDYSSEVSMILSNLQRLVSEASTIKQQLAVVTQPVENTSRPPVLPNIIRVTPVKPKQQQIALTTFPNVISGIVRDASNNYLEGVIAVIHDREGLPVRALKTNKLGQFMGSTPLPNSIYTLELEKEGYSFDVLQIELTGTILPPIMITAK